MFQHRHYLKLLILFWFLSSLVPCSLWSESFFNSFCTLTMAYVIICLHNGSVNSISHTWGWKPYDTGIEPTFSRLVVYLTLGEGYHNFHHTFPKDYSHSELYWTQIFNVSALLIDLFEYFGWVSDKKVVDPQLIQKRRIRTGDLSVKMTPTNVLFEYLFGLVVFSWSPFLIFSLRYCLAIS